MPPTGTTPQDTIRWLTSLLSALCKRSPKGELRISRRTLRQVNDVGMRQVLLEDLDSKRDEIVLRFGSKHSAIYPVEPECPAPPSNPQPARPSTTATATLPGQPSPTGSRRPLTDEELGRIARKLHQERMAAAIKREQTTTPPR